MIKTLLLCCIVLVAVTGYAAAQESQHTPYFEGRWEVDSLTKGTMDLCVEGNNVFGGYNLGYLEATLSPDRRTMVGMLYSAGNDGTLGEAEFKVSMTGNNNGFVGELTLNGEVSGWSATKISDAPPSLRFQCLAPDTTFGATIEGQWSTGTGQLLNLCLDADGLRWTASFADQYHRGVVLPFAKGARGAWWSDEQYGGSIFRLIGENTMVLSAHTNELSEVREQGCNTEGGPQCTSSEVFQRVGPTSPNQCGANSALAVWNGWYSYTPAESRLALRRAGRNVYGSFRYGILEGQVSDTNPYELSGVWYNAAWDSGKPALSQYYGEFKIKLGADLQSFDGDLYLGIDGSCGRSQCEFEWTESRLVGPNREPNSAETFSISQLPNSATPGSDGSWIPEYNTNVRFYLCSQWRDDDEDEDDDDDEDGLDQDIYGRQQWLGSYTDFGCGRVTGGLRGEVEIGTFETTEPLHATSNGVWFDDSGFGNQIQRRINADWLHEEWFAGATPNDPPSIAFCDPITESNCGTIDYTFERAPTHDECLHCFMGPSSASQLAIATSLLIISFIAMII